MSSGKSLEGAGRDEDGKRGSLPANAPADIVRSTDQPRTPMVRLGDGRLVALKPGMSVRASRPMVDICFVFDTTGSMTNKIDGLINCLTDLVDQLGKLALDWRTTCVPFGDLTVSGDRVDAQLPFVSTVDAARGQIRQMPRFSGGGNEGESAIEAMLAGLGKPWRRNAVKLLVLLTDEPALGARRRANDITRKLRDEEVICFVASTDMDYYKSWARDFGGRWFAISAYMDTSELMKLLRSMVRDVARVAHEVHSAAGGSVSRYLQLAPSKRRALDAPE